MKAALAIAFILLSISLLGLPRAKAQNWVTLPMNQPLDWTSLTWLLDQNHVKNREEFIQILPPTYRRYYALLKGTAAAQIADKLDPRVLAFGAFPTDVDAVALKDPDRALRERLDSFVFGIQTSDKAPPTLASFFPRSLVPSELLGIPDPTPDTIESIEYLPKPGDNRYHVFRAIHLSGDSAGSYVVENTTVRCELCHGTPPRPNWTNYPVWGKAFGSVGASYDDTEKDAADFAEFLAQKKRGVLAYLEPYPTSNGKPADIRLTDLTDKLKWQYINRAEGLIRKTQDFDKYQYLLYAGKKHCTGIPEWLPDSLRARFQVNLGRTFEDLYAKTKASYLDPRARGYGDATLDSDRNDDEIYFITVLRYVFEGRGMNGLVENWLGRPPAQRDIYRLATHGTATLAWWMFHDPAPDESRGSCEELQSKFQAALKR